MGTTSHLEPLKLLAEAMPYLRQTFPIARIGVFGSAIRGDMTQDSDIDVLVEFNGPITLFQFMDLEMELTKKMGRAVDLVDGRALKPNIGKIILSEVVYV